MRTSAKLGLTALIAALLLSAAVSTASARSFSITSQNVRATWRVLEFASSAVTVRCPATLEGSFHSRTIAKVAKALIGAVTRFDIQNPQCTNGTAATRNFPWHITYVGFIGTLPRIPILILLLSRFRFQIRAIGLECEYGNETDQINGNVAINEAGEAVTIEPVAGRNIVNRIAGSFLCPSTGTLVGTGNVTVLNSSTRIRITLI